MHLMHKRTAHERDDERDALIFRRDSRVWKILEIISIGNTYLFEWDDKSEAYFSLQGNRRRKIGLRGRELCGSRAKCRLIVAHWLVRATEHLLHHYKCSLPHWVSILLRAHIQSVKKKGGIGAV